MVIYRLGLPYYKEFDNFVFVEFEDVNVDYRLKTANSETDKVRKGLNQIRD